MNTNKINLVYDSKTGNNQRFVDKLKKLTSWNFYKIDEKLIVNEEYHLLTYTTGIGMLPENTKNFLDRNPILPATVTSSGNMNWGPNYGKAADIISADFSLPILMKFELSGTQKDVEDMVNRIEYYYKDESTENSESSETNGL